MNEEPIVIQHLLELDDSEIKVGDIIYIFRASNFLSSRIASRNYIVEVEGIIKDPSTSNFDIITFKDKENILLHAKINDVVKLKTYSYDEINHNPGDLFFSTKDIDKTRRKNIVYESVEGKYKDRVYYMPDEGNESCSILLWLKGIKFLNINNNLDLKSNNEGNSYIKLLKSFKKRNKICQIF